MINQNDILAALQSGADPEVIAQQFADALNSAIAEKAKEDAKQNARQEKIDAMAELLDGLIDFIEDFYPDLYDEKMRDGVNAEAAVQIFDEAYEETMKMRPLLNDLQELIQKMENKDCDRKIAAAPVDPIAEFLRNHNL